MARRRGRAVGELPCGGDDHAAVCCRRRTAVGQCIAVVVAADHRTAHGTGQRVGGGDGGGAGGGVIGRPDSNDGHRHRAGAGVSASPDQAEGEQVDQAGQTMDRESAGSVAHRDLEGVGDPGQGRLRAGGVDVATVVVDHGGSVHGRSRDREGQYRAVGVDGVEVAGDDARRALCELSRVQPRCLVVEEGRDPRDEPDDRIGPHCLGREASPHRRIAGGFTAIDGLCHGLGRSRRQPRCRCVIECRRGQRERRRRSRPTVRAGPLHDARPGRRRAGESAGELRMPFGGWSPSGASACRVRDTAAG